MTNKVAFTVWIDFVGRWRNFKKHQACRAGSQVDVETTRGRRWLLIGDINELGGVCDDCVDLDDDDVVYRWRELMFWKKEDTHD